ncbi:hypothetical protein BSZ19_08275 [Bradyrhizobium japonicum]|uniref:Uncharacterized protein n=1 Tax=Bradyrhizobium japonicum TaxID=375 RepID=A0A1Y2JXF8_BRAJP|nr:hypothetical protein BSZ19_08275 [Bradyrhizobium japonicum]
MPRLARGIQYAAACPLNHNGLGVLDRPVKPGDDTERVGARSPNLAQLSHFATLFPLALSFGTTLERIAAESLTPAEACSVHATCRGTLIGCALDGVLPCRTSGVSTTGSLKLGTARSRIRIEEESNGFQCGWPPNSFSRKQPHAQ